MNQSVIIIGLTPLWAGSSDSPVLVDAAYDGSGANYLHFGTVSYPFVGIDFQKQIVDNWGFSGAYSPTQLRDTEQFACGTNGLSLHRTGVGLDAGTLGQVGGIYRDSPAISCDSDNYYVAMKHDNFQTFLMFQPGGGIPVPLKLVIWNWYGSADSSGGWHKTSGDSAVTANDQDTTTFPFWTNVVNGVTVAGFTDLITNICE